MEWQEHFFVIKPPFQRQRCYLHNLTRLEIVSAPMHENKFTSFVRSKTKSCKSVNENILRSFNKSRSYRYLEEMFLITSFDLIVSRCCEITRLSIEM